MRTQVKEELAALLNRYPQFEALTNLINQLEHLDASPDTLVDYAHALTEGVSKNARRVFDAGTDTKHIEKQTNTGRHLQVLRPHLERLDRDFDENLFECIHALLENTRDTRNKRGDTSHGHLGPKEYTSAASAKFWLAIAIAYARYVFELLEQAKPDHIIYNDHSGEEGFNIWLNTKGIQIGGASYSWLLYEHDYAAYENFLDEFQYLKT
jgi:hypothetical protein